MLVLHCIETSEKWAKGEATIQELKAARAAYTADSAAYVASVAASVAADSASITASAASYAVKKTLSQCADIVREFYPNPPRK